MPVEKKVYRVQQIVRETPLILSFRLVPREGAIPEYKPGQFFNLFTLNADASFGDARPYSVASAPHQPYLEFTVKMLGRFPDKLAKLKEGDEVGVMGPLGSFTPAAGGDLLLIAGGVGVAPLMSMIRHLAETKSPAKVTLVMSQKTPEDVCYAAELGRLQKENANLRVFLTMTRPEQSGEWKGLTGRINAEMLQQAVPDAAQRETFICGSVEFADATAAALESLGMPKERIHAEKWG